MGQVKTEVLHIFIQIGHRAAETGFKAVIPFLNASVPPTVPLKKAQGLLRGQVIIGVLIEQGVVSHRFPTDKVYILIFSVLIPGAVIGAGPHHLRVKKSAVKIGIFIIDGISEIFGAGRTIIKGHIASKYLFTLFGHGVHYTGTGLFVLRAKSAGQHLYLIHIAQGNTGYRIVGTFIVGGKAIHHKNGLVGSTAPYDKPATAVFDTGLQGQDVIQGGNGHTLNAFGVQGELTVGNILLNHGALGHHHHLFGGKQIGVHFDIKGGG